MKLYTRTKRLTKAHMYTLLEEIAALYDLKKEEKVVLRLKDLLRQVEGQIK